MVFIFRRCWEEENSRQFVWTAEEEEEEESREITLPPLPQDHKTTRPPSPNSKKEGNSRHEAPPSLLPPFPFSEELARLGKKGRKCH